MSTAIWLLNIKNCFVLRLTLKSYIPRRSQDRTKRHGKNDSVEIIGHTYFFTAKGFTQDYRIPDKQFKLPATIEDIDGKQMIVFTVKTEGAGS